MPRRRSALRTLGSVLAVALAATSAVLPPVAAGASDDGGDDEAWRVLAVLVADNNRKIAALNVDIDAATARLAELAVDIAATVQRLEATRAEHARLRDIVRSRAAFIYREANAPSLAMGEISRVRDLASGSKYAQSATRVDTARVEDLRRTAVALETHREELQRQQRQQEEQRDRLQLARDGLEALNARQRKLLDQAGAVTLMGEPSVTAEQVTAWFTATRRRVQLAPGTSLADLVQLYYEEGANVRIRPDVAFAQSIIETGSFGRAADNNYSGIGACDSCTGQPGFPTPRDGVRGQMQLLRNYADPSSRASDLGHPVSPTIWGSDPEAAARTYDSFSHKGRAPTWNVMGGGNWATDPNYAHKVLGVYFDIVAWSARRAA